MNSLAEILLQTGQQQAESRRAGGAILGQTIGNVAQQIGGIPAAMQEQKREQQEQQLQQAKIDDLKRQQAGRQALGGAIKQFTAVDPSTGAPKIDHEKVANAVSQAGFPDQANAWLKQTSENSDAIEKLSGLTAQHAQAQRELIGDLIYTSKTPEDAAAGLGVLASTPGGGVDEQTAHQIADTLANDPAAYEKLKAQYLPFSPRFKKEQDRKEQIVSTPEGGTTTTVGRAEAGAAPLVTGQPKPPPVGDFKGPTTNYQNKATGNPAEIDQHTGAYLDSISHQPIKQGDLIEIPPPRNPESLAAAEQVHKDAEANRRTQEQTQSYDFHLGQMKELATPVEASQRELSNLRTLIDQHDPQADADVAVKLLTVFAGGTGSGLRMNQATIERNAGGHTAWVGLQQTLNKFSTNPNHEIIPEAQRQQIYRLLGAADSQIAAKQSKIQGYRDTLANPDSTITQHRQGLAALHDSINKIETGDIGKAPQAGGGMKASATNRVVQNGVKYDVTTDAAGKVISSVKVP